MTILRAFLIMLLAIAIPLEGLAAVRMTEMPGTNPATMQLMASVPTPEEPCAMPMQDDGMSNKSTPVCKMTDACKICQVFPSTASAMTVNRLMLPLLQTVALLPESFFPSHDPSGLWRPPRSS